MRVVVKSGSAMLSKPKGGLDPRAVRRLAAQLAKLHKAGHEVILVSSGAIAAGSARLGLKARPTALSEKQAVAAVGQVALMKAYEEAFRLDRIIPAQILLTREDLIDKKRYVNVRNTVLHLLKHRVIPILNENDSVSTAEIQVGDNDTLSAVVATKVDADKLVLLSDVPGVFHWDENGKLTKDVMREVKEITADMEKKVSGSTGSKMSVGGMATKFSAAKLATAAGIETWIASGYDSRGLEKIISAHPEAGTRFHARRKKGR